MDKDGWLESFRQARRSLTQRPVHTAPDIDAPSSLNDTHAHTEVHTHTDTHDEHAHTRADTHAHLEGGTHTHAHTEGYVQAYSDVRAHTHAYDTQVCGGEDAHTHAHTHTPHTHAHVDGRGQDTQAHAHTPTHAHAHTGVHTHAQTHEAQAPLSPSQAHAVQLYQETNESISKLKNEIRSIMDLLLVDVDPARSPAMTDDGVLHMEAYTHLHPPAPPLTRDSTRKAGAAGTKVIRDEHPQASSPLTSSSSGLSLSSTDTSEARSQHQDRKEAPKRRLSSIREELLARGGQNMGTILAMMKEEKEASKALEQRILELEDQLVETESEYEVKLHDAELQVLELKKMLRRISHNSTFADVFSVYETHVQRVEREAEALRERNVYLELKTPTDGHSFEQLLMLADDENVQGRNDRGTRMKKPNTEALVDMHANSAETQLRRRLKEMHREMEELRKENSAYHRRERQQMAQKRMVEGTWMRVQKIQAMAKGMEEGLAACRLETARAEARLAEAEEEIRARRRNEDRLKMDRDKALLELGLLKRQFRTAR